MFRDRFGTKMLSSDFRPKCKVLIFTATKKREKDTSNPPPATKGVGLKNPIPLFFVNRRRIMQAGGDLQPALFHNPPERAFHDERVERANQVEIEESQPVVVSDQGTQVYFACFGVNREVCFQVFVVE